MFTTSSLQGVSVLYPALGGCCLEQGESSWKCYSLLRGWGKKVQEEGRTSRPLLHQIHHRSVTKFSEILHSKIWNFIRYMKINMCFKFKEDKYRPRNWVFHQYICKHICSHNCFRKPLEFLQFLMFFYFFLRTRICFFMMKLHPLFHNLQQRYMFNHQMHLHLFHVMSSFLCIFSSQQFIQDRSTSNIIMSSLVPHSLFLLQLLSCLCFHIWIWIWYNPNLDYKIWIKPCFNICWFIL